MAILRSLRHAVIAVFAVALLAMGATDAHATHFRYGTIRWAKTAETADTITLLVTTESAWRCTFFQSNSPCNNLVSPLPVGVNLIVQRTQNPQNQVGFSAVSVDIAARNQQDDWFVGTSTHTFIVNKTDLPVRIFFASNARLGGLRDNNGNPQAFRLEAIVSATPNAASPTSSILPIVTVGTGPAVKFFIPAADVEGDTLTWSIAPLQRSALATAAPNGEPNGATTLSIDPSTGEVTWNTSAEAPAPSGADLYAVQFIVTDSKGGETPVDVLLRIVADTGTPPVALIDGTSNPYTISVRPNTPVTFTLMGFDADPGASVTLTSGALPPGAIMTPSLPTAGSAPLSSTFTWTPTLAQTNTSWPIGFAVTDNFGQQDQNSAIITVLNNRPPVASCVAPVTIDATSTSGATTTLEATVSDPDGDGLEATWIVDGADIQTITVAASPNPTVVPFTHLYAIGPHTVSVRVDDGLVTSECPTPTIVTVIDRPPVLVVPADQTLEATGPLGAVATWPPVIATDAVDGPITATCTPASGSMFAINPVPVTTVTCEVTDSGGNHVSDDFTITVQDTTPPTIHNMPANMTVPSTTPTGAFVSWPPPNATDLVDVTVPVFCVPTSGSFFLLGSTPVTCTATDAHTNQTQRSFIVKVVDGLPPVVTVTLNPGVLWPPDHRMIPIAVTVTTQDGDPNPSCAIVSVTSNQPVNGTGDGDTDVDWAFNGLNLKLRRERAGNAGRNSVRIYTVTVACTDSSGNVGTGTATARVVHDQGNSDVPAGLGLNVE